MENTTLRNKTFLVFFIWILGIIPTNLFAQGMPNNPREILKTWDYYVLTENLGEGTPIIDSMAGKAFIAGMQYQEKWFGKDATASYYFSDIDINAFKLRFWSPNFEKNANESISDVTNLALRDSLLRVFQIQDSLRNDSVRRILQMKPDLIKTMNDRSNTINAQARIQYDLDSIRCDSLIFDISKVLGQTLRQDTTSHTELARYSAIWIEDGAVTSLKDYTHYTDLAFTIPNIKIQDAIKYGLSSSYEIYEKLILKVENEVIEISLAVLPLEKTVSDFKGICLIAHNHLSEAYLQKVDVEKLISNPSIRLVDFNNDQLQEIWVKYDVMEDTVRRAHKIFAYEDGELLSIFDSYEEIIDGIAPRLLHGFQAEVSFADGSGFMFPINKNSKAIQGKYNSTGVLLGDDLIVPEEIKYLKVLESSEDSSKILEGRISLKVQSTSIIVGDILVHWNYVEGYWHIIDYQIIE